ncbi:putative histone H2A.3 [Artemisia annua]|uniref:Histone H2A n=1 Tax=Artemisia annua TaxID=35608 RepID=A0A2U1PDZ4_ARTAN|nr:putative histone H2A.3 [Artemisia annua]
MKAKKISCIRIPICYIVVQVSVSMLKCVTKIRKYLNTPLEILQFTLLSLDQARLIALNGRFARLLLRRSLISAVDAGSLSIFLIPMLTSFVRSSSRIVPRHIQLAVRNDEELSKLLSDVTIANGSVMPNIHNLLLPKKAGPSKPSEDDG